MSIILIVAFVAGLLMFLVPSMGAKANRIGEILLLASAIALLSALAPLTVKLLQG